MKKFLEFDFGGGRRHAVDVDRIICVLSNGEGHAEIKTDEDTYFADENSGEIIDRLKILTEQ